MKRAMIWKRHRPEGILAKLREADEALSRRVVLGNVARIRGMSFLLRHRLRTEYGSTDRNAVGRVKRFERENGRRRCLFADQASDLRSQNRSLLGSANTVATVSAVFPPDAILRWSLMFGAFQEVRSCQANDSRPGKSSTYFGRRASDTYCNAVAQILTQEYATWLAIYATPIWSKWLVVNHRPRTHDLTFPRLLVHGLRSSLPLPKPLLDGPKRRVVQ
jgi:putative transposase